MLYAIDSINNDRTLLPGIRLGCHILDTCLRDTYALEQSLEFIRPYLSSFDDDVQLCADGQPPITDQSQQLQRIAGVIGASASVVSVMVANMLQLFKVRSTTDVPDLPDIPLTSTVTIMRGTAIKHPVPDRVKPSFVIFDIWTL